MNLGLLVLTPRNTLHYTCCINISWCKHWTLRTLSCMCCTEPSIHTLLTHYNPTGLLLARHFGFSSDPENCTNKSAINILWDVCKSSIYSDASYAPCFRQDKRSYKWERHTKNCIWYRWARLSIDKWMHPELYLSFQSMLNERFVPSFKFLSDFSLSACLWTGRSPSMHPRPPDNRSLDPCTYCIFAMVCGYFIYFSFEFGCLLFVFGSGICCNALRRMS